MALRARSAPGNCANAEHQRDCTEVWDVLVLARYSSSAIRRSLLLAKINWHVFLALCCCCFQSDSLFFCIPGDYLRNGTFLNTASLPSPAWGGLLPCQVLPYTLQNDKPPFPGAARKELFLSSAHLLIINWQNTSLTLAGYNTPTDAWNTTSF